MLIDRQSLVHATGCNFLPVLKWVNFSVPGLEAIYTVPWDTFYFLVMSYLGMESC